MRKIKLAKMELAELEVIQMELLNFCTMRSAGLIGLGYTDRYFSELLILDVAHDLFRTFRNKVENLTKTVCTVTLATSEAVVLLQCCTDDLTLRNDYERHVMRSLSEKLHKQLVDLMQPVQHRTFNF